MNVRAAGLLRAGKAARPTVRYWMTTEVHVYAFSIAANTLLSFFPFLIVMVSLCRAFRWKGAEGAIFFALSDYFPETASTFIANNLKATLWQVGPLSFVSFFLLFFTANGIFEPLEVAFNRAWGILENRSFVKNQIVSLGLIFICGGLVLASTVLTAINRDILTELTGTNRFSNIATMLFFKAAAVPISILMLFLIYWLLPNRRLPAIRVLPAAVVVGLLLEGLKYINLLIWPWLYSKLEREYGPFKFSVAIILWSFCASMLVLAGAEWAARDREEHLINS
jgi:membrane protein